MGCGSLSGLILLAFLGFCRGQSDSLASRHRYDCGEYGMQLLVFPSQGQNIHFKVVDEFRTAFEVSNCSSCFHWITSNADGAVIFSAGYNGCHVLEKDGRNHLKVRVEERTRNGAVAATQDFDLICPKQEPIPTLHGNMHPIPLHPDLMPHQSVPPQPGLVPHQTVPSQPGLVHSLPPQLMLPQPGLKSHQPMPPEPSLGHPMPPQTTPLQLMPPEPSLVHPMPPHPMPPQRVPPQPGLMPHRLLPPQPGPMPHQPPQPGLVLPQPDLVPHHPLPLQPSLVHLVPPHPMPPQHVPQQPGLMPHQPLPPQPGLGQLVPSQPMLPQPGLGHPVPLQLVPPQPGLRPPMPHLYSPIPNIGTPLTLAQCQVPSGKIPCAGAQGPAACYQAGCCYNEGDHIIPCYYGNTVTVQCLQDGHFILVVSRHILDYPVILDTVRLSHARAGCDPTRRTDDFLVFHFSLTQCGTTVQMTGGRLIYENQLVSSITILNGPDGSITRDSTFILHTRCIYNATDFLLVQAEVVLPSTPAPISQMGPLHLELRIATDASYRFYYSDGDYPVVKVLGDLVYVEVRVLQRMDPSLVLVLHECWASPSANPVEQLQWPILVDGCPFEGDNYRTRLVPLWPASSELPFPAHYQRFIISTFTFVDSGSQMVLDGLVYLFCSVSVCYPSQLELCRIQCRRPAALRSRRFLEISNETESLDLISTYGAVIFQESNQYQDKQGKDMLSNVNVTLLLLVALPLLGIILLVAILVLWKKSKMAKLKW